MLTMEEIGLRCAPVFEASPVVSRAYVFGSYARGEQDEDSDVDICYDRPVPGTDGVPRGLGLLDEHGRLRRRLEEVLGIPVDLLVTPDERSAASRAQARFAREVARDRRGIYERA